MGSSSSSNLLRSAASNAQGSRNEDVYVELHVNSFRAQFGKPNDRLLFYFFKLSTKLFIDEIEAGKQYVRRIVVALDEVELIDHIPSSDVHTLLCYDRLLIPLSFFSPLLNYQLNLIHPK